MKKTFIKLFEIYIFIIIIAFLLGGLFFSEKLGINSGYMLIIYLISMPLIFGTIIIQIDNNEVLHEIRDGLNKLIPKSEDNTKPKPKSEDSNNLPIDDETTRLKKIRDESVKNFDSKFKK